MSFATMATIVTTRDLEGLDALHGSSAQVRVQLAERHVVVWRLHDFDTGPHRHRSAQAASVAYGEAFHLSVDTVLHHCISYAHYRDGRRLRSFHVVSETGAAEDWQSDGEPEPWEAASGVGTPEADGEAIFFGVLERLACPPRPEPEPAADWNDERLEQMLVEPRCGARERRRALELLEARTPGAATRLRQSARLPVLPVPATASWAEMGEDQRIIRALGVDTTALLAVLGQSEDEDEGPTPEQEVASELAEFLDRLDAGWRG
jgi:hypothetical protein